MTQGEEKAFWKACQESSFKEGGPLRMFADALRDRGDGGDAELAYALEWMADYNRRPNLQPTGRVDDEGYWQYSMGWVWYKHKDCRFVSGPAYIPAPVAVAAGVYSVHKSFRTAVAHLARGLARACATVHLKRGQE